MKQNIATYACINEENIIGRFSSIQIQIATLMNHNWDDDDDVDDDDDTFVRSFNRKRRLEIILVVFFYSLSIVSIHQNQ